MTQIFLVFVDMILNSISGVKAYLHDRASPSWLPTLELGHKEAKTPAPDKVSERYKRASQRKHKREVSDAVSSLLSLKKRRIEFSTTSDDSASPDGICTETTILTDNDSDNAIQDTLQHSDDEQCKYVQTDLTLEGLQQVENDNKSRMLEADAKAAKESRIYCFKTYMDDPDKVPFYTGLPNVGVLKLVFDMVESQMSGSSKALTKEEEFFICLVKLRMNYLFKDIAYHLNVSITTVQKSFHSTLDVLYARLQFLVKWPTRENLRMSMPQCFRRDFGQRVVVVMDCFELFTERPSSALNKVYTYSNYKHHQTIKYLIGIAPQGVVTFISDGWGGRTSDKHLTEQSGVLNNLLPGDIVMVDRGFNIEESVRFYQAELAIPSFTRGKSQLHPLDVEKTRKIASVRIHVERVIGLVLRKFRIFEGIIPLEFIKLKSGDSIPTIDKIVMVCCCLTNICPSVVPFD